MGQIRAKCLKTSSDVFKINVINYLTITLNERALKILLIFFLYFSIQIRVDNCLKRVDKNVQFLKVGSIEVLRLSLVYY